MSFQSFIDSIKSGSDGEIANKFKIEYLEMRDEYWWRPLHHACRYGRVGLVKILIENKCDINASNKFWGYQPIHSACWNGHIDIVKILIKNKCDIDAFYKWGYQPIHLACWNGHIDIVKILIENKCDINASNYWGYQPIHLACKNGHVDVVKILIENKCNINAFDGEGYQPIHWACENGHIDIVKILIENKCDINASDGEGTKPIHLACINGHIDIVKLLIENKCDINAFYKWGYQPIHLACRNGHIDIVKILIENKCDINASNKNGYQPIHWACEKGHLDIVKILIENKCDINASDELGYQPIHWACMHGYIDIVKILIENKCDINAFDGWGYQLIHLACRNGHIDIVKILIGNKCDINVSDKYEGYQPIHWACENGHIDIVQILIDNNCDRGALTKDGESVIDIAKQRGYQEIIDIINPIQSIITALDLKCSFSCNHKFCRKTLKLKKMPKGELLGKGSFGKVYKYKISNTNREIVIKQIEYIPKDKKNIESNINKFSPQIIHRNIVRHFGALEKSGKFCIFMEYISGGSLKDLIDKVEIIEINKVIQYSKQILDGLQFLHSKSIIHRDIKPENILLDRDEKLETIKLTDFGISRSLQKSFIKTMDKVETCCGTPYYMAPEVILEGPYDYPADIWSTGATIIHMITGEVPYHNLIPEAVLFKIGTEKKLEFTPPQPISETMQSFINDLLIPDQSKRPSAEVLLKHSIFDNVQ